MPPIISIVGTSGSGKTTLLEGLIPAIRLRGYKVGVIKHSHHAIEVDRKGKDSYRHKAAGAETVMVVGRNRLMMARDCQGCDSLDTLALYFQDMDLVLTEGYKRENRPKIEVFRPETGKAPIFIGHPDLVALVATTDVAAGVPVFGFGDVERLADFIEETYLRKRSLQGS